MLLTCCANGIYNVLRCAMRAGKRSATVVEQSLKPLLVVAREPFIGSLATDAKASGQFAEGIQAAVILGDELVSFFHGFSLVPRHDAPPWRCTIHRFTQLLPMFPV